MDVRAPTAQCLKESLFPPGCTSITWGEWEKYLTKIILGVPLPILVWGAIGGTTAPLYKYLGFKGRYEEDSFKSFVLRPFIGILMGAVIYLIVKSGLIVFGNIPDAKITNPELLWVFAFIGGFSEGMTGRALTFIEGSAFREPPSEIERHSRPIQQNSINGDKQERAIIPAIGLASDTRLPVTPRITVKNTHDASESSPIP